MAKINATDQIAEFFKTVVIDPCEATTGWAALGNDTTGLETDLDHVYGTVSLEFDKVNGTANTVFGAIAKTISALNVDDIVLNGEGCITWCLNLSSLAAITTGYAFIRLGTSASHYNEWRIPAADLKTGWNVCKAMIGAPSTAGATGNGWNSASVTYICIGVAFDAETSALADIRVDRICLESCRRVSADITNDILITRLAGNMTPAAFSQAALAAGTWVTVATPAHTVKIDFMTVTSANTGTFSIEESSDDGTINYRVIRADTGADATLVSLTASTSKIGTNYTTSLLVMLRPNTVKVAIYQSAAGTSNWTANLTGM